MESSMFQAPLAISYLFTTKELGVQTYIANKLFTFPEHEVDFYLPQLISMYIHIPELASLIYPYLKHRYVVTFPTKRTLTTEIIFQMHQECWILTPCSLAFRIILIRRPHYEQKEEWWYKKWQLKNVKFSYIVIWSQVLNWRHSFSLTSCVRKASMSARLSDTHWRRRRPTKRRTNALSRTPALLSWDRQLRLKVGWNILKRRHNWAWLNSCWELRYVPWWLAEWARLQHWLYLLQHPQRNDEQPQGSPNQLYL